MILLGSRFGRFFGATGYAHGGLSAAKVSGGTISSAGPTTSAAAQTIHFIEYFIISSHPSLLNTRVHEGPVYKPSNSGTSGLTAFRGRPPPGTTGVTQGLLAP